MQSGILPVGGGRYFVHCAPAGTPDRCLPGLGWIEVKKPGGKLSKEQLEWKAWAERIGINYACVDNVADGVAAALRWKSEGGKA